MEGSNRNSLKESSIEIVSFTSLGGFAFLLTFLIFFLLPPGAISYPNYKFAFPIFSLGLANHALGDKFTVENLV